MPKTDGNLAGHWIDAQSAVSWVAFRNPNAWANWDEFSGSQLHRSWPEWGLKFGLNGAEKAASTLMEIMRSRAKGRPWHKPHGEFGSARAFRAYVRKIMRDTGSSASELADQLAQDIAVETGLLAKIDRAKDDVLVAVRNDQLKAFGRMAFDHSKPNPSAVHEVLGPELFLGPRVIDLNGWVRQDIRLPFSEWEGYKGPHFDQVRFRASDILALWPFQEAPVDTAFAAVDSTTAVPNTIEGHLEWMAHHIEQHMRQNGFPIKRDNAISDCQQNLSCTWRQALAAWNAAPAGFKRNPRQTGRALAVQRAHAAH